MSKAWATGRGPAETLPLLIGQAAGEAGLTVPSSVYIGDSGHIYLGSAAERQHLAETQSARPRFDNLKRMLREAEVGTELRALPLRDGIDPTHCGITGGDLLVLYFSWLTDLSEAALEKAISATAGKFSVGRSDIRGIARRFAIPCFESADGKQGEARAKWARQAMIDALLRAQILADLAREWRQLTVGQLKPLMEKLYRQDIRALSHLMIEDCAVREPLGRAHHGSTPSWKNAIDQQRRRFENTCWLLTLEQARRTLRYFRRQLELGRKNQITRSFGSLCECAASPVTKLI